MGLPPICWLATVHTEDISAQQAHSSNQNDDQGVHFLNPSFLFLASVLIVRGRAVNLVLFSQFVNIF